MSAHRATRNIITANDYLNGRMHSIQIYNEILPKDGNWYIHLDNE